MIKSMHRLERSQKKVLGDMKLRLQKFLQGLKSQQRREKAKRGKEKKRLVSKRNNFTMTTPSS